MGEAASLQDHLVLNTVQDYNRDARRLLLRRLVDVVSIPISAAGLQDRAIAGDLLLEVLIDVDVEDREICAKRLAGFSEAPRRVLRFLAQDVESVSSAIIADSKALDQSDLAHIVRVGTSHHRKNVAKRRDVGPCVADALVETEDAQALTIMLGNSFVELSDFAVDRLVTLSRDEPVLSAPLMKRSELRPAQALVMFWWADHESRFAILKRFSAERNTLIEICSDLFVMSAKDKWNDPLVRKGLQVIERRQRNREALKRSAYDSLESAIAAALKEGMTRTMMDEISYLCGIKPLTGAKIFSDEGGEGIAILCKAVGLKRQYFRALWMALRKPAGTKDKPDPLYSRVEDVFETIAVAKAQTVLRYWNWSLSAAFSPEILGASEDLKQSDITQSHSERSMRLVFGQIKG